MINLNKRGGSSGAAQRSGGASSPSSAPKATNTRQDAPAAIETYGRSQPPPPPGSSYWEFQYWASEGSMAFPEDTDLAIKLWMGDNKDPDESSSPRPR